MKRITIVGGGASGTLSALNLIQHANGQPVEINLVESRDRIGRGVAFGTSYDTHLLNVPAGKMGAYPDNIEHFHEWLTQAGHSYEASDFVPRRLFGEYLRHTLNDAIAASRPNVKFNMIDDHAVDLSVNDNSAEVILRSGEILPSDHVVLAFGNFSPPLPAVEDHSFAAQPLYFKDPWGSGLYEQVGTDDPIFIIGTGLSMVDVALHFHRAGHRGMIKAISTRGLLPEVHELGHSYPSFLEELRQLTRVTEITKRVRRHIAAAESNGSNWRAVIDSLRPATQQIWLDLPVGQKRSFKQHMSRYWNIARHRMPPEAAEVLKDMQADGQLEILKGRLRNIEHDGEVFKITFTEGGVEHTASARALVNCIGSESNFSRIDSQFVQNLFARGHIRNDELSFGIDATPDGSVVNKHGHPTGVIHTLGTALKGILWESTAVPEIRTQARQLSAKLLAA